MVDTQQTADTPKAILFQIEPDGLLSKRGGIGIGARAFGVAMAAVAAKIALPAIHSLAISDLTMLTATGRADKGFGELILHNMLLYHRFLVTACGADHIDSRCSPCVILVRAAASRLTRGQHVFRVGLWLSWESAAFASRRSGVRIPSAPPSFPFTFAPLPYVSLAACLARKNFLTRAHRICYHVSCCLCLDDHGAGRQ